MRKNYWYWTIVDGIAGVFIVLPIIATYFFILPTQAVADTSNVDLSAFLPIRELPFSGTRFATSTCSKQDSTTTECVTTYVPEITYSDWLFVYVLLLLLVSPIGFGVIHSVFRRKKHYNDN